MASSGTTYEQIDAAFRKRTFQPLYFFYGEEGFLAEELQRLLIETALEPHERDFNLDLVYGFDLNGQAAVAMCSALPMMAPRRVVIIREFEKMSGNDAFKTYAQNPNPHAVVLLACSTKPNLNTHPYRALKEKAVACEFASPYQDKMPAWISKRVKQTGYEIEGEAAQMLAEFVGNSLRSATHEIDKLITYAGGRKVLTTDDVLQAGGHSREFNVFELQKAIGGDRLPDALRIAERLLQQSSQARGEALMIVSVLAGFFQRLWHLRLLQSRQATESEIAKALGIPPFFMKEYVGALRRYSVPALEQALSTLLAADFELKGGRSGALSDEWTLLLLLLRRLTPSGAAQAIS